MGHYQMCRTERLCLKPFMPGSSARTPAGDRSGGGWALKSIASLILYPFPGDGSAGGLPLDP